MKILVLGGTGYVGIHLVNGLIPAGHEVTIATRGKTADDFGGRVKRKVIDRQSSESLASAFKDEHYDAVIDNLAYSSNDVRYLLEAVKTDKYVVTSTVSVYSGYHHDISESEMNTKNIGLIWGDYKVFPYDEAKRQAEAALFQAYPDQVSAAVRFPFIFGKDDDTKRLYFYIEHVMTGKPMHIDNLDERLSFISSGEAGRFLAWASENDITGPVNAASIGKVSLKEIIRYTEEHSGREAVIQPDGDAAPLNTMPSFSLDTIKASTAGFTFKNIESWLYPTIDYWIDKLK